MNPITMLTLSFVLSIFIVGLIIFTKILEKRDKVFFILYLLGCMVWSAGSIYVLTSPLNILYEYGDIPYISVQILYFGVGSAIFFPYFLFRIYKNKKYKFSLLDGLSLLFYILFVISAFYKDFYFSDLAVQPEKYIKLTRESGVNFMTFYIFYFYFLNIYTIRTRIKLEKSKIIKRQLQYMFWGNFIFVTSGFITNWGLAVLLDMPKLNALGPSFYIVEAIIFFYAATTLRFYNFGLVALKVLQKVSYVLLSTISLFLFLKVLNKFFGIDTLNFSLLENYIYFSILLFFFLSIYKFFSKLKFLDNFFRIKSFDRWGKRINEFKEKKFLYKSLIDFERDLYSLFVNKLFIDKVFFLKKSESTYNLLKKFFVENKEEVLVVDEMKENIEFDDFYKGNKNVLQKIGTVFIPIHNINKKSIVDILVLGEKKHRALYSIEEIKLIMGLVPYVRVVILFLKYNLHLENEVSLKTSSLKEKTKDLRTSNKKLKKLDETKDNFLSMASHELRTPMTVIKGYTDFLLSENFGKLNKEQVEFVNYIKTSSNGLLMLVNDMLDLSKIEADMIEFEYEEVDLKQCFEKIFKGFEIEAKKQGIDFTNSIDSKLPKYIIIDKQKIRLILNNLIGNAFKFTPEKKSVNISIAEIKGMLVIGVKDRGIGIEEEDLGKVFEKFGQVKNYLQKDCKGTGLGLSIVKKVLEKMDGTVEVKSKIGKGTTFTVKFPILKKD